MTTKQTQNDNLEWEVLNPLAEYERAVFALSPRLADLNGKTVGLFWNGKPNGNVLLEAIGKLLEERFKNIKLIKFWLHISVGPENQKQMAEQCDAVIAAQGD
jgi:hypothetical protein